MHFITLNLIDSYGGIKTECAGSTDITTSFQTNTEKSKQEDPSKIFRVKIFL